MKKSYRILIIVLACVLVCGAIGYSVYAAVSSRKPDDGTTTSEVFGQATESSFATASPSSETAVTSSTTATTETTTESSAEQLLGKWTDGAGMSGFEFFADGSVTVTYVNVTIPILNVPVEGNYDGVYTVTGNKLTTSFSIYTATVEDTYTFVVNGSSLKLTNTEDGETATYKRASSASASASSSTTTAATTTQAAGAVEDEIVGTWINSTGTIKYVFSDGGAFQVVYNSATVPSIDASVVSGTYSGIYIVDASNLTIQYVASKKITENYTCVVSKNTMLLTDTSGVNYTYCREGTGGSTGSTDLSDLMGKWMDASNVAGFEFQDGGYVKLTYVNFTIPVIGMPITGTFDGSYTASNGVLHISYTVVRKTIRNSYTYVVNGNTLTLTNTEDGSVSTYLRKS